MILINDFFGERCKMFDNYAVDTNRIGNWRKKCIDRSNVIDNNYLIIKGKYPIIDESIDYYIEILELSMFLLKKYNSYFQITTLQNKFIDNIDYFNSSNLIKYFDEKDFAEYLRKIFFANVYRDINLSELLYKERKYFNYELVVARLIYPNYYFDVVDGIISNENNEEDLKKIVNKREDYIKYIYYIVDIINSFVDKKIIIHL